MATYAIGDVQGCFAPFTHLLEQIRFDPVHDRLWFVGDLVNRGPNSVSVLRLVKGLGNSAITVLGNHDLHLLALAEGIVRPRRSDTVQAVMTAPDRDELLLWLRRRPLLHRERNLVLVHAGLPPQWTVEQAEALAREAEQTLQSDSYPALLRAMYRRSSPCRWSDNLTGMTRLAVVTGILTRMRVCTREGLVDFSYTGPLHSIPPGFLPWFDVPGRKHAGTAIVCGHWAALGLQVRDNLLALDAGCVWGRQLTAIRLDDRRVFQVSCENPPPQPS